MALLGSTTLTGCNSIPDFIAGGTRMFFRLTNAPTSWTKDTSINNRALRVVSGTVGSGGSSSFTTVFSPKTPSGTVSVTVGQTSLSTSQFSAHSHSITCYSTGNNPFPAGAPDHPYKYGSQGGGPNASEIAQTSPGGGSHSHPASGSFSGQTQDFNILYEDIIISTKD